MWSIEVFDAQIVVFDSIIFGNIIRMGCYFGVLLWADTEFSFW